VSAVRPLQVRPPRPLLRTPWYAAGAAGNDPAGGRPQLHEYRGADFMDRFDADLKARRLTATSLQTWYQSNRLDGGQHPSLRQAIHDGFYIAACEISCDGRAAAPLDPVRVVEAWAEVHPKDAAPLPSPARLLPQKVRSLTEKPAAGSGRDLLRPLPIARILSPAAKASPAARIPLRPQLVTDAKGRRHTLLAGHLPLTDQVLRGSGQALPTPGQLDTAAQELADRVGRPAADTSRDHVLWRPGALDDRLGSLIQLLDENLGIGVVGNRLDYTADFGDTEDDPVSIADWRDWLGRVHFYAEPEAAPNTLFVDRQDSYRVELNRARAHVRVALLPGTAPAALRNAIGALADALGVAPPARTPRQLDFDSRYDYTPARIATLTGPWLAHVASLRPLVQQARTRATAVPPGLFDITGLRTALDRFEGALNDLRQAAEGLNAQFASPHRYRRQTLLHWLEQDRGDTDKALAEQLPADLKLICPGAWIADGPDLIRRRWRMLVGGLVEQWQDQIGAAEALAGGDDRLYQVSIHARVRGDQGCEYLVHSAPSLPFHVASFYETRLMRPRPIRMPSLKDLKKAVSGAAMILPDDLNAEVSKLRFPDGEVEQSGIALAGRWIYVFSIPIVTICAMILLMLMITILDFIFRWIPYAILRIPLPR
jgi:hypothetical protein